MPKSHVAVHQNREHWRLLLFTTTTENPNNSTDLILSILPFARNFAPVQRNTIMSSAKLSPSPMAVSTTIKHFASSAYLQRPCVRTSISRISRKGLKITMSTAASKTDPLEVCVKESVTVPNKLGDCKLLYFTVV